LARAGKNIDVPPGTTIVDALRAFGIDVDTSCEQGVCGTCVTRVLDGVPEHRDLFLTDAEKSRGDCMAICVSRALTRHLVLDL
jgi:vanillate O-demethylase ferredoxin subunit